MAAEKATLDTFPKLLMHHARVRGEHPAIREKDLGIWQTWTWRQFADEVRSLACGLALQGLKRGDHFALVGDNRPRLYAALAAAQALGAIPVPLYQDAVAAEMAFPIQNASIAVAFVEDQEQVDKLLEILPQCPTLKRIVYDDPRGLRSYAQPQLVPYEKVIEAGRESRRRDPSYIETEIAKGSGADTAAMFFTSGTTGVPKGVVHTHASLIGPSRTAAEHASLTSRLRRSTAGCSCGCSATGRGTAAKHFSATAPTAADQPTRRASARNVGRKMMRCSSTAANSRSMSSGTT